MLKVCFMKDKQTEHVSSNNFLYFMNPAFTVLKYFTLNKSKLTRMHAPASSGKPERYITA